MRNNLPMGFRAGTAEASFKKPGRPDLGIIYSELPCTLAALFTTNIFCAAPVQVDKKILESGKDVRAVVANAGQANSCTGAEGLENCYSIQRNVSKELHIEPDEVLLISTGVIGAQFDMRKWQEALPEAVKNIGSADAEAFTRSFMTTDAFPKYALCPVRLQGGEIHLAVMAKGAGMICPNMATMLCVALCDASVERRMWQQIFGRAVAYTFNRVSVDGDTSTNDTILGLANGASGVAANGTRDMDALEAALTEILGQVAEMLVRDGEGCRRLLRIVIKGAGSSREAETVARAVGSSQLVKTAIYGGDANWGRIINAVGYSGVRVNPADVSLWLCGIERFRNGQPVNDDMEQELTERLKGDTADISIILGDGSGEYALLASDLGHEYVTLNSDYRS